MSKNTNNRARGAAIALAVVGVAGLTMAAATQLNLAWAGEFQAGAVQVEADCQTSDVGVSFTEPTWSASAVLPWAVQLQLTGIDAACTGNDYKVDYKVSGGTGWTKLTSGEITGTSLTLPLGSIDASAITDVALTIHS